MFRRSALAKVCTDREQHFEVYINLISTIANISVSELIVSPDEDGDINENDDATAPLTFGTAVHAKAVAAEEEDADSQTPLAVQQKSVSLLHTEDMIWHLLRTKNATMTRDGNNDFGTAERTFGLHLFSCVPVSVTCLSHVLEMLSTAIETLGFHAIIYHIASIVAFQHYIRLVVLRTGQFAPQHTMNIQTSYQQTLLEGLLQVPLTITQQEYIRTFDYSLLNPTIN